VGLAWLERDAEREVRVRWSALGDQHLSRLAQPSAASFGWRLSGGRHRHRFVQTGGGVAQRRGKPSSS
jgi:hypothetical protein